MHRPRVLVVDDSVVVRRLVSKALEAEDEVEVVGVAADGSIALANIERLRPDVVILDVAMPVMDGLAALAEIRERWPMLPVIMFSTLTSRGAEVTLDALALGASDYVLKPSGADAASSMAQIRADLLPRIAALLPQARESHERTPTRLPSRPSRASGEVAQGERTRSNASTSSRSASRPAARPPSRRLIPSLPGDLPVPIVDRAAHAPDVHEDLGRATRRTRAPLTVVEASDGDRLRPGTAYIAPGDRHLAIAGRDRERPPGVRRPARELVPAVGRPAVPDRRRALRRRTPSAS